MNTISLKKRIRRELENLNDKIDAKIVRGRSYAWEARKHKELLCQLYNLNRQAVSGSWFGAFSTFRF
ncbi:MAG TPA: hypothetical protein VJH67_01220 [Candidatus Paceibacterota bacterium]